MTSLERRSALLCVLSTASVALLLGAALGACGGGGSPASAAPQGQISDVAVVVKNGREPLPFDPRGGRVTVVTEEIRRLVGHPVVLEIDVALSPELASSLEETVLASFETIARELVLLQKEDPAMFAKARAVERVALAYDAVAKESAGELRAAGKVLAVRAPPDRFPLLERWILTEAVYSAHIEDLEARWGEVDPARLPPREHAPYFAYMTKTRPGAGYLWISHREKRAPNRERSDDLRVLHVARVLRLAGVVETGSPLARKVRQFLLQSAPFVGGFQAEPPQAGFRADPGLVRTTTAAYAAWLNQNVASFDDADRSSLERVIFRPRRGCASGCSPDAVFPGFDHFAFGLSIYDEWVKDGARAPLPPGPRGDLHRAVVCPSKRRGESETEIRRGCSGFFELVLRDEGLRARLVDTITKRRDTKLLEITLLNVGHDDGPAALAFVESFKDDSLSRQGTAMLFHDLARRDDVRSALESAAPRWWRDTPTRRGFALLVMARQREGLHVHYGDNQWARFVAEFGGPVGPDVLASYLAEGPRAIEMTPKIWPALAKGPERDALVAKSLPVLLERDREARSSRSAPMLTLLRKRLCDEKNSQGLAEVRSSLERWSKDRPDERASVSNALADFTLARCAKPSSEDRD